MVIYCNSFIRLRIVIKACFFVIPVVIFNVEFVTGANHKAEQAARDNLKNAKPYKSDWVQKSAAYQNYNATDADKKPAPQPAKAKTGKKIVIVKNG